jgi:hypothetical protein
MRTIAILTAVGLLLAASATAQAGITTNLVYNGDFSNLNHTFSGNGFMTVAAGQNGDAIPGWTVIQNSVDWINTYWNAPGYSNGVLDPNSDFSSPYSLDMAGSSGRGAILSQSLNTVAGQTYQLTFEMSGNPEHNPSNGYGDQEQNPQILAYIVGGSTGPVVGTFAYDDVNGNPPPTIGSNGNMQWQQETLFFTANGPTTLTFASDTGTWCGPVLADVSVVAVMNGPNNGAVPAPAALLLGLMGLSGLGVLMRRFA